MIYDLRITIYDFRLDSLKYIKSRYKIIDILKIIRNFAPVFKYILNKFTRTTLWHIPISNTMNTMNIMSIMSIMTTTDIIITTTP